MEKSKMPNFFANIIIPVVMIALQILFQFSQFIILEVQIFGLQDPNFDDSNKELFYKNWGLLLLLGLLFIVFCAAFIVLGTYSSNKKEKSKKTNILLLCFVSISILSLLATLILEMVMLVNFKVLDLRVDLLWNWGFYFIYWPVLTMFFFIILTSFYNIKESIKCLKSNIKNINIQQ